MNMVSVTSSKLVNVGFDPSAMILRIEFRDGVFEYFGVPERIYIDLMEADSKGIYFKRYIKDRFRFVRV
ncbi:KTSC domain-containing protein [Viridibacillus sp. NPDC096237]|uniref:KTSC domain-containing protein n=1 Tax=Viridibacillus sp. NPDC096237 TaxID=3390721 RepID=UPI003D008539